MLRSPFSKVILLLLAFVGAPDRSFAQTQQVVDDFEGNGTIQTWARDNCLLETGFLNPVPGPQNPSSKVLRYEDVGGQYANVRFDIPTTFDLSVNRTFQFKIYVPSSGLTGNQPNQVSLKLQNAGLSSPWITQSEIIKPIVLNQWQTVSFNFASDAWINLDPGSAPPIQRNDFSRVLIQINGENNYDRVLAYVDDFQYDGTIFVPVPVPDPVYNNLVWADEFDGNGAIDGQKWFHQTQLPNGGSWYNGELQHYTNRTQNASVSNGLLRITARRENFSDQGYTKAFTSARLNSKFAFTYGRVEVRAKLPAGVGTWPAIWTLGKNINEPGAYWQTQGLGSVNWPACGEIDIMEHWGINQNFVQSAMHTPSSFGSTVNKGGQVVPTATSEFHVYSLEWNPNRMIFKVDGVVHYIYNPTVKNASTWPFTADQYLLLNLAIEPSISANFTQAEMQVDYVRVYQGGLTGGSIQGPLQLMAGSIGNYTLSGWSGSTIAWQKSTDAGQSWTQIEAANTENVASGFDPGNVWLRARISESGYSDVYSNTLQIQVSPRTGDGQANPLLASLPFQQTISTAAGSGFTNAYSGTGNQPSPDVFYRVTTGACAQQVEISTCGSDFDTRIHFLDANGNLLAGNEDGGPLCSGNTASLRVPVLPNTSYFAVIEGQGSATGNASVSISEITQLPTTGTLNGSIQVCRSTSGNVYSIDPVAGATSYVWTLPSGAMGTSSSNSISVSFSSTFGGGNMCVSPQNNCVSGPPACLTLAVVTATPAQPGSILGQTTGLCSTATQTYTVAPVNGASTYTWTIPANTSIVSGQGSNQIVIQFEAGFTSGTLGVKANNCRGSSSVRSLSLSRNVSVPASVVGPRTAVCGGSVVTYSTAAVNGSSVYTWAVPAGVVINQGQGTTSITATFPPNFTSGAVTVRSGTACFTSSARSVTVYAAPTTPSSISGQASAVCGGTTQTYTCPVSTTGATTYNWTIPAGATLNSGQGTNTISITFPAGYSAGSISVRAANSCGTSSARTLTVRSVTAQPGTISGQSTNLCAGGSFNYSITPVTGASAYQWTAPAGCSIITQNGTSVTLSIPAGFVGGTLSVSTSNGCGASTARTLALSGIPATPASISGPTTVCPSATGLVYSTEAISGVSTYTWGLPAGTSITSGAGTNSITVTWGTVAGSVSVKAGNACGTRTTARILPVTLLACQTSARQGFSVEPLIQLFPNPGQGEYQLEAVGIPPGTVLRVTDMLGKEVLHTGIEDGNTTIRLDGMAPGTYVFHLTGNQLNKTIRVMHQ
jgi:beta-glucanase (GH16 family)